ncbi:MAG: FMN phosphatase YigB (HAD superfamily) [Candidatus Azotimanducaceae bacterium]
MDCAREEIVFFDDSEPNVDAARRLGWNACLTRSFDELAQATDQLGL